MPYFDPKFPIVKPEPSVDDCIKSARVGHYSFVVGTTAASWISGFIFGKPARFPTAAMAATLGFSFAVVSSLCDSRNRLMGFKENTQEIKQWGKALIQPEPHQPVDYRYPVAQKRQSVIRPKVDWDAYK
jgi:NADH-ubiquinone oxidoreductase complex I, 21 kDa subunit